MDPALHDQAEDRCHRIGQHDAVTAWYLLAAGTIDETMAELIARKRGVVGAVTDGRAAEDAGVVDAVARALRDGEPFRASALAWPEAPVVGCAHHGGLGESPPPAPTATPSVRRATCRGVP